MSEISYCYFANLLHTAGVVGAGEGHLSIVTNWSVSATTHRSSCGAVLPATTRVPALSTDKVAIIASPCNTIFTTSAVGIGDVARAVSPEGIVVAVASSSGAGGVCFSLGEIRSSAEGSSSESKERDEGSQRRHFEIGMGEIVEIVMIPLTVENETASPLYPRSTFRDKSSGIAPWSRLSYGVQRHLFSQNSEVLPADKWSPTRYMHLKYKKSRFRHNALHIIVPIDLQIG